MNVSIIGFGEAGPVFALALKHAGMNVLAFDRLQTDSKTADLQVAKTNSLGIGVAPSAAAAVRHAELLISTVTASEAVNAVIDASPGLHKQCHWIDLNSVSPGTKTAVREHVEASGATFTEAVAMDTVPSKGAQVPILLCGPFAEHWSKVLNAAGMNTRVVGTHYGMASTTKLLRSVIIKGMESLFAESMEAASIAGVHNEVLQSLQATYPELNWHEIAGYQLSRASLHAQRRAAEMREASRTVQELGVHATMSKAIAAKQQELADRDLAAIYEGATVDDYINATRTMPANSDRA